VPNSSKYYFLESKEIWSSKKKKNLLFLSRTTLGHWSYNYIIGYESSLPHEPPEQRLRRRGF
jgi:hypothetical protein